MSEIKELIASYEGTEKELYRASNDKYALISVQAKIDNGMLIVTDYVREHGPDENPTFQILDFDEYHTESVFRMLLEMDDDPFKALENLLSSEDTDKPLGIRQMCDKRGITYRNVFFDK